MLADPRAALPAGLTDSALFRSWGADSLKLYLWLRAHARRAAGSDPAGRHGYLVVDVPGAELERAIGISKNTVTKVARELQARGVATFQADRAGYHFRLGEWFVRPAAAGDVELRAEAYYLDSALAAAASQPPER